jgi:hypothetical protein
MRLVHVQQLDFAAVDVVNATMKLSAPSRIDLGLIHVRIVGVKASQTAMDHGSTIMLIEGEERLLDFRDVHGHASSVSRPTDHKGIEDAGVG